MPPITNSDPTMSPEQHATFEATMAATGSKVTYGGAGATVFGWFTSNEFAVVAGVTIALGGFIVNWYYRHKEDRRRQAEHERKMGLYK
jgi:hypothetical protein